MEKKFERVLELFKLIKKRIQQNPKNSQVKDRKKGKKRKKKETYGFGRKHFNS